jgi:hypothetical protein
LAPCSGSCGRIASNRRSFRASRKAGSARESSTWLFQAAVVQRSVNDWGRGDYCGALVRSDEAHIESPRRAAARRRSGGRQRRRGPVPWPRHGARRPCRRVGSEPTGIAQERRQLQRHRCHAKPRPRRCGGVTDALLPLARPDEGRRRPPARAAHRPEAQPREFLARSGKPPSPSVCSSRLVLPPRLRGRRAANRRAKRAEQLPGLGAANLDHPATRRRDSAATATATGAATSASGPARAATIAARATTAFPTVTSASATATASAAASAA